MKTITITIVSLLLLFVIIPSRLFAADDKTILPTTGTGTGTPVVTVPVAVPLEISADFFAADADFLREQAKIPAELQSSLTAKSKLREEKLGQIFRYCADVKGTPQEDPKNKARLVCVPKPADPPPANPPVTAKK